MSDTIHASAILLPTGGVLLLGASASGKSSLVAQLMTQCGGQLVADDRVCLSVQAGVLHAAAPQVILQALTHLPQHGFSAGGVYGATETHNNDGNDAAS